MTVIEGQHLVTMGIKLVSYGVRDQSELSMLLHKSDPNDGVRDSDARKALT